jgi:hypothetical protein
MHGQRNIKIVRSGVGNTFNAGESRMGGVDPENRKGKERSLGISWPDVRKYVTISGEKW